MKMCADCFYHLYPNTSTVPRKFKRKQHHIHSSLVAAFGENFFEYDVRVDGGCSRKIPDWFRDCFTHVIIIECDENQHYGEQSCDEVRMIQLWEDVANRPIVFIRFNPDVYEESDGHRREGCFSFCSKGLLQVDEAEYERRFRVLEQTVQGYLEDFNEIEEIHIVKLFFDEK